MSRVHLGPHWCLNAEGEVRSVAAAAAAAAMTMVVGRLWVQSETPWLVAAGMDTAVGDTTVDAENYKQKRENYFNNVYRVRY